MEKSKGTRYTQLYFSSHPAFIAYLTQFDSDPFLQYNPVTVTYLSMDFVYHTYVQHVLLIFSWALHSTEMNHK